MQSRSGNKCHLQCPQQANAIAKPNLWRYLLLLWSAARLSTHGWVGRRLVVGGASWRLCKKLCQDYYMDSF